MYGRNHFNPDVKGNRILIKVPLTMFPLKASILPCAQCDVGFDRRPSPVPVFPRSATLPWYRTYQKFDHVHVQECRSPDR